MKRTTQMDLLDGYQPTMSHQSIPWKSILGIMVSVSQLKWIHYGYIWLLGLEKINHHENKSNSRSNIQKCCWVPFELWNKRIIPSQRVRIIARSEIYFLKIWGKSLPLSDPTRGWCSIFCNSWVQISHISGISSSPFHACRWLNYSTLIPSSKETQASVVCIKSWWDFIL